MTVDSRITIIDAIQDSQLIGDEISEAQEMCLRVLYGLPLNPKQVDLYNELAGKPPGTPYEPQDYREGTFVIGRRGGKSDKLAANTAIYEGCFRDHSPFLSPGETGMVLCLSQTLRTKIVFNYILAKLQRSPILSGMIAKETAEEIHLTNGIIIACYPCSFKAIRGLTVVCSINDEVAFWQIEGVNPDREVMTAIRPAMVTIPHAKLIKISSPYAKAGEIWEDYRRREERSDVLVIQAPTVLMNPSAAEHVERERGRDPENALREYDAIFAEGLETFLPSEAVDACVREGETEDLPRLARYRYFSATDAAFVKDRFTFCVAHTEERKKAVVDVLRGWERTQEKGPVDLEEVAAEIARLAKEYRTHHVVGDQYAAEPLRQALRRHGTQFRETYRMARDMRTKDHTFKGTERVRAYITLRQAIIKGLVSLPDHKQLLKELKALEMRRTGGGGVQIGHPRHGGHTDDFADVVALAVAQTLHRPYDSPEAEEYAREEEERRAFYEENAGKFIIDFAEIERKLEIQNRRDLRSGRFRQGRGW
ncbi:MAG: hypothetical protein RX318_02975 [bacterium]|nr:hypothetical protein [bacterium]